MLFGRPRRLTRVQIAWMRRAARKREAFVTGFAFPGYFQKRVQRRLPDLSPKEIELVEWGLREWFVCCAWRWNAVLGMPSRAVDEAWHELILDTPIYTSFCLGAFGRYLHHTPDEAMRLPMGDALLETVRAWDRSEMGREEESILWDLDLRLGIENPLGVDDAALAAARTYTHVPTMPAGMAGAGYVSPCFVGGGSGGDGGGGGGGGCGGGGGGGAKVVAAEAAAAEEAAARPGAPGSAGRSGSPLSTLPAGCRGRGCRRRPSAFAPGASGSRRRRWCCGW
jgi:hypothetical protein